MEKIPKLINIGPKFIPDYRVGTLNLEMDTIWRKEHTLERDMDWKRHSRMNATTWIRDLPWRRASPWRGPIT